MQTESRKYRSSIIIPPLPNIANFHRRRKVKILGGPRFRILGGGGKGGPNSQQAHDVVLTSMRRNDVASTSFRRHVPTRF